MSRDVVGASEIAERASVHRRTVYRWSSRGDFPAPLAELARGAVWDWADVETWLRNILPTIKTGRPPKGA